MSVIVSILGVLVVGMAAVGGVVIAGMHASWSPVKDRMRRLTIVLNSRSTGSAGQPGAGAGILRHVGRHSGTIYETPLDIEETEDGFVVAVVYGERTQWLKNMLAAGSAEVVVDGRTYAVDRPEVLPMADVSRFFKPFDRRLMSLVGVDECLRLHHADRV